MLRFSIPYLFLFLLISCGGNRTVATKNSTGENQIQEAEFFTITQHDGYQVLDVIDPWDTTKLLNRYILVNKSDSLPTNLPKGTIVRTPVERIVAYTAVDIGSLAALGVGSKIVGVCEAKYIVAEEVKKALIDGKIKDLGTYTKPNIEQMLSTNADLIIASPYSGRDYGLVEKLGIPIAQCASYMEKTPLGRCEWLKFYAAFINQQEVADSIYTTIADRYRSTAKMIAERTTESPSILSDKRYGQVWYIASGKSYIAQLFKDAGASYHWADREDNSSIPLSFETVLKEAHDTDVWFFNYYRPEGFITLDELKSEYSSYAEFKAFKEKRVYGCNTNTSPFYEESPLRPDYLLLDIAKMLHPILFEDHQFVYYQKLE